MFQWAAFIRKIDDICKGWKKEKDSYYNILIRLQHSPYFCVFKYARAVKQKVWNEAENRERVRPLAKLYRFLYWFWEKNPTVFAVYILIRNWTLGRAQKQNTRARVDVFLEKSFTHESEALLRKWILELFNQHIRAGHYPE